MTDELKFYDPETGKPLHRVPEGVTIPARKAYGFIRRNGNRGWVDRGAALAFVQLPYATYFTREPIAPPKPPLPTEPGSLIRAVGTEGDECAMMIRLEGGAWFGLDQDADDRCWGDKSITSWEPMTVIPTETWDRLRVLDPEDKRDRVDVDGDFMEVTTQSKAEWGNELAARHWYYGPLRFADEVSDR